MNILIKIVLITTIIIYGGCTGTSTSDNHLLNSENRMSAPAFALPSLKGKTIALNDFSDKYVVIHIATTWCPFCNAEAPYLEKLYQDYKNKNVEVLIIDVMEPASISKIKTSG